MQEINIVLIGLAVASAVLWILAFIKHGWRLQGLLPQRPRPLPFWNAGDALVMFGLMLIITAVVQTVLYAGGSNSSPPERDPIAEIWASVMSGAAAMAIMLMWLRARSNNALAELGMPSDPADFILGFKAALMILPPVLLISAGVSQLVDYQHPVLDILKQTGSPLPVLGIFWCTAVVTPLVEEFLFRVMLIGGLERLADAGRTLEQEPVQEYDWAPPQLLAHRHQQLHLRDHAHRPGCRADPSVLPSPGIGLPVSPNGKHHTAADRPHDAQHANTCGRNRSSERLVKLSPNSPNWFASLVASKTN